MDSLSNLSLPMFDSNRSSIMIVNVAICCLSFILLIVSMSGNSTASGTVKNGAWTLGLNNDDEIIAWYGLKQMVLNNDGGYSYSSCADGVDYCSDCETAGKNSLNATVFVFFFNIAMLVLSVLRRNPATDSGTKKVAAVVTMSVSLVTMIIAMGVWNNECMVNLPTSGSVTIALGPGMNCILTTFLFSLIVYVSHLFTAAGGDGSMEAPINKV